MDTTNIPQIGTHGASTIGGDAYPVTVVAVSRSGHRVTVQHDRCRVVSGSEYTNDAVYEFERNTGGQTEVFTRRPNGRYRPVGSQCGGLSLNGWVARRDPSF